LLFRLFIALAGSCSPFSAKRNGDSVVGGSWGNSDGKPVHWIFLKNLIVIRIFVIFAGVKTMLELIVNRVV